MLDVLFETLHDPRQWSQDTFDLLTATKAKTKCTPTTLTSDPQSDGAVVYRGDLHVKTNLTFNGSILVLGDLHVDGVITAPLERAILMVVGNVYCRAVSLRHGYLFVTKSFSARDCFYGCASGFAMIAGTLKTRLYLHDTWSNVDLDEEATTDNIDAPLQLDLRRPDPKKSLRSVLTPEALGDGPFDPADLLGRIARGEQVFV